MANYTEIKDQATKLRDSLTEEGDSRYCTYVDTDEQVRRANWHMLVICLEKFIEEE